MNPGAAGSELKPGQPRQTPVSAGASGHPQSTQQPCIHFPPLSGSSGPEGMPWQSCLNTEFWPCHTTADSCGQETSPPYASTRSQEEGNIGMRKPECPTLPSLLACHTPPGLGHSTRTLHNHHGPNATEGQFVSVQEFLESMDSSFLLHIGHEFLRIPCHSQFTSQPRSLPAGRNQVTSGCEEVRGMGTAWRAGRGQCLAVAPSLLLSLCEGLRACSRQTTPCRGVAPVLCRTKL